jgi:hypothetical protein
MGSYFNRKVYKTDSFTNPHACYDLLNTQSTKDAKEIR